MATKLHLERPQDGQGDEELRSSHGGNQCAGRLVARNELNRVLVWEIDGPSYYRSSTTELDGASSPRSYFFMAHDLPAGLFDIRVTVKRNDNTEARDRGQIRVAGAAN